jgi:uracil-DNA glycosylase
LPALPAAGGVRDVQRAAHPDWYNAPVPTFGDPQAWLAIVGLAPGLQGANRTGRPFTGDFAGVLLYQTLLKFGLAEGTFDARPDDGLQLRAR